MKFLPTQFFYFMRSRVTQRNLGVLARFVAVLVGMVTTYSVAFHWLMEYEGRHFSWVTGFYWTLTVMSTLGFGDITFVSDAGRLFSILVLLSGMIFLLVLLPFTFIEFFYEPWMRAQEASRAPRELPAETRGHVLITSWDAVTSALVQRLKRFGHEYVVLLADLAEALRLNDEGVRVAHGDLDDPATYERMRAQSAALVVTTQTDPVNTNVAFTVRGVSPHVPIVATARDPASVDILQLAGCNRVLQLGEAMGQSLARRTFGGDALSHVIGEFGKLLVAEATARRTPMVGKTLREHGVREKLGITVAGVWERGRFEAAHGDTRITESTILLLAGSREQLDRYDEAFCIYNVSAAPVVIIGGGRVGRATGLALSEREVDYRIVEQLPERIGDARRYVQGNAAELAVLERAQIGEAPSVVITPHDDDMNVYLTIYCRRLRPDIQIVCRATHERTVATLHRAGADVVMSYASMGANVMMNLLRRREILLVAEGLELFRTPVPARLAGRTLAESGIREQIGCNVVALERGGEMDVSPDPEQPLPADAELILIGSVEAEDRFLALGAQ
jgi:Trk K+ transport system NAD-binding subunit